MCLKIPGESVHLSQGLTGWASERLCLTPGAHRGSVGPGLDFLGCEPTSLGDEEVLTPEVCCVDPGSRDTQPAPMCC